MSFFESCLACLCGRRDDVENDDTSRPLLGGDAYRNGYGSSHLVNGQPRSDGYQPDSESMRREREALDGICHSMSDVEDLFISKSIVGSGRRFNSQEDPNAARPMTPEIGLQDSHEVALRTIKKGASGPISNALRKQPGGWRAVQDAIG